MSKCLIGQRRDLPEDIGDGSQCDPVFFFPKPWDKCLIHFTEMTQTAEAWYYIRLNFTMNVFTEKNCGFRPPSRTLWSFDRGSCFMAWGGMITATHNSVHHCPVYRKLFINQEKQPSALSQCIYRKTIVIWSEIGVTFFKQPFRLVKHRWK